MSEIVPASEIEQLVGIGRHHAAHYGRAVSAEQTFYILHSQACLRDSFDLRVCDFSLALDRGIDEYEWSDDMDSAVQLVIFKGRLVPMLDGPES